MNYQLMRAGFLPINIRTENRVGYYDSLDVYASTADLSRFADFVAQLEMQRIEEYMEIVFEK